ncbi:ABC-type Fe3+ transport system permease subunit [Bradyrhizobium sp. LM6.11]
MAITLSGDQSIPAPPLSSRLTPPQIWGIVLLAPYLLVFLAFVVYPVGYGLWLARAPSNYVALYNDPIFARAAVNTLIFLLIGINIKMLIALFLSALLRPAAHLDQMALGDLHPALGSAVDPDHSVGALHVQPRMGHGEPLHLLLDWR